MEPAKTFCDQIITDEDITVGICHAFLYHTAADCLLQSVSSQRVGKPREESFITLRSLNVLEMYSSLGKTISHITLTLMTVAATSLKSRCDIYY